MSVVGHSSTVSKIGACRSRSHGFESGGGQKFFSPTPIIIIIYTHVLHTWINRPNNIVIIEPVQVGLVVSTSTLRWATLGRLLIRSPGLE